MKDRRETRKSHPYSKSVLEGRIKDGRGRGVGHLSVKRGVGRGSVEDESLKDVPESAPRPWWEEKTGWAVDLETN